MEDKKLTSVFQLFKSAVKMYFKEENLIYLTKMVLVSMLIVVPVVVVSMVIGFLFGLTGALGSAVLNNNTPNLSPFVVLMFGVVAFIMTVVSIWFQASEVAAVANVYKSKIVGVKETLKLGWARVRSLFVSTLVGGLLTLIGLIFFIVPGVILAVWWSFSSYAVVTEGLGGIAALKRSKELVSGYFWPVFIRMLIFILFALAVRYLLGYLNWVGSIIIFLMSPLLILIPYTLYEDLKRVKGTSAPVQ